MDELRDQLELLGCEDEEWPNDEEEQEYDEGGHGGEGGGEGGRASATAEEDSLFLDDGPDDLTCAICLGQIQPLDLALVKGCEHQYCVHCILQWAMLKEWCPQCKAPFSYLFTHRHLDGTPSDYPLEESVTLLKRARWFVEEHEAREKAKAIAAASGMRRSVADAADDTDRYHAVGPDAPPSPRDWCDLYEDMVDAELEEDEAIEDFYYSSAAGRARIVLGNRRWGGGGYMRSGRMYARPVNSGGSSGASGSGASTSAGEATPTSGKGGKGKAPAAADAGGKGKGKARAGGGGPVPRMPHAAPAGAPPRPKVPKSVNPLCDVAPALAASPLGRSPGCGSYGSSGTAGSWMAAAGAVLGSSPGAMHPVGSAPGSGRRAKRNARRAAADAAGGAATPATPARTVVNFTTAH